MTEKQETCNCKERKVLEDNDYIWQDNFSEWRRQLQDETELVKECPFCNKPLP